MNREALRLRKKRRHLWATYTSLPTLSDVSITSEEVHLKLLKLNTSGAPGPDGLHPRVLKEHALHAALHLSQIFNACLQTSSIPDEWRHAVVVPIFMKGRKRSANNCRSISLTSTVCKTMEPIMRDETLYHLTMNNLLMALTNTVSGLVGIAAHSFLKRWTPGPRILRISNQWTQYT